MINKYGKGGLVQISTVFGPLMLKVPLKQEFFDISFTTVFGVRNFRNTSAMRRMFFLKILKI